jgi:hypothetical protein
MSGMGQALASLYAKKTKSHDKGAEALLWYLCIWLSAKYEAKEDESAVNALVEKNRDWTKTDLFGEKEDEEERVHDFFNFIHSKNRKEYNVLQVELLSMLEWFAKYATAILPKPDNNSEGA